MAKAKGKVVAELEETDSMEAPKKSKVAEFFDKAAGVRKEIDALNREIMACNFELQQPMDAVMHKGVLDKRARLLAEKSRKVAEMRNWEQRAEDLKVKILVRRGDETAEIDTESVSVWEDGGWSVVGRVVRAHDGSVKTVPA